MKIHISSALLVWALAALSAKGQHVRATKEKGEIISERDLAIVNGPICFAHCLSNNLPAGCRDVASATCEDYTCVDAAGCEQFAVATEECRTCCEGCYITGSY